jgi:hypothetical protein
MNRKNFASLIAGVALTAATCAWAGSWSTQATLASSAYQGTIGLDAAGNMTSVWFQYNAPNGTAIDEIWASSAAFGKAWSAPADVSGNLGPAQNNPGVRVSAAGDATVVYTNQSLGTVYNDKPAGGSWGTTHATNGVNGFYVSNDAGVEGMAWGTGGARPTSSTIVAQARPVGGAWSTPAILAAQPHLAFDGATIAPDGTMAVAWESFDSTCGSRTCKTSNWVLHISTLASGSQTWVDSGGIMGPDTTQHFAQLAGDSVGDLGVIALQAGNVVSKVRHGAAWSSTVIVVSDSGFQYYTGTGRDNRIFFSDSAGHATLVGWGDIHLDSLAGIDGNLSNNTWGAPTTISGSDQFPNYFDFAMSSSGTAIVSYSLVDLSGTGTTTWRAITRSGAGKPWNAPATTGTSFEGGGTPDGVAVNAAGQAAVVFHGLSSDYLTNILYTNTYKP